MRILLVAPSSDSDVLSKAVRKIPYVASGAFFGPHALATVAALTPRRHQVEIHDEQMRGPADGVVARGGYDVVGISLATNQVERASALASLCRASSPRATIVVGGIGAAVVPRALEDVVDAVFVGEAEETWPAFLDDRDRGETRPLYKAISKPDLSRARPPRWDLIARDVPRYGALSVQTTRGCPFDCSFCDVIYTYGRKLRQKSTGQVLREVRLLAEMGVRLVYVADDNFAGDRRYAKGLLHELKELNRSLPAPITFMTQADVTIAHDPELLELMADCNFAEVQVGIESVSEPALREMNKKQNLRLDLGEAVRTIQSYGIVVYGHLIVGLDSDDLGAFDRIERFVDETSLVHHTVHPLMAPAGTKLWYELKRQGRIVELGDRLRHRLDIVSNVVPKQMSRVELMDAMVRYWTAAHAPERVERRTLGFVRGVRRVPRVAAASLGELWRSKGLVGGMLKHFGLHVEPARRRAFFAIAGAVGRERPELMQRVMYLQTSALIDFEAGRLAAELTREQAAWERADPDRVRILSSETPMAPAVRARSREIFDLAYRHLRPQAGDGERLCQLVVAAVVDYADRFGKELDELDAHHRAHLAESCDRVAASQDTVDDPSSAALPDDPPAGFAREMLNAVDWAMRRREDV